MKHVVRTRSLDASRRQLVTQFVLGFFAPTGTKRRMPILESVSRDEVHAVVLDTFLEYGRFPLHADMVAGDPPMYIGEQIRALDDCSFLVANIEFYDRASKDGTSMRVFNNASDAVAYFVRARVSNLMYGVPVL